MTRERFEQILFAHVSDEVVQDMLNQYVLELESSNAKLRELLDYMTPIAWYEASERERDRMRELGVEVD